MTARRAPSAPAGGRAVRWVAVAVLAIAPLVLAAPSPAGAAGGLEVVAVNRTSQGTDAVVALDPAPLAPLAPDAVTVTALGGAAGTPSHARVVPVLDTAKGTPTALVVDASQGGAPTLQQTLSGATGLLLDLPSDTPVAVVADRAPPAVLTPEAARPADAIRALTTLSASGERSTTAALALAADRLRAPDDGACLVVLTTSGPPPAGDEAARLVDRLVGMRAVLGVIGTGSSGTTWADLARRTGGAAVAGGNDLASAYRRILGAMEARYLVSFTTPPDTTRVQLTVTSAGQRLVAVADLPQPAGAAGAVQPSGTSASRPGGASKGVSAPVAVGLALLVVLVLAGLLVVLRRGKASSEESPSRSTSQRHSEPEPQVAMSLPSQPALGTAREASPEPADEATREAGRETEPEPAREAEPEPAREAEPEPAREAEPEPAREAEPDPAPAATAETTREATSETPLVAAASDAPLPGVRRFDVSDPHRPTEITGPAIATEAYVGKHREPGVTEADVADDPDDGDGNAGARAGTG